MKKIRIMLITIIVISIGVLSGCEEQENGTISTIDTDNDGYNDNVDAFPNNASEHSDTDKDGWGDNSDDFPYDANLHELHVVDEFWLNKTILTNESFIPADSGEAYIYVPSDCKFIVISTLFRYYNETKKEWILAADYPNNVTAYYKNPLDIFELKKDKTWWGAERIEINYQNFGEWRIWIENNNLDLEELLVHYIIEIYR
jgi:hypothetical protein